MLAIFTTLPQILKQADFSKLSEKIKIKELKVTPFVYVVSIGVLVCSWTWIKSGQILGEGEKHGLVNLVGMYYTENCDRRKAVDVIQNFNNNNILITKYARENLDDMTADNTILITEGGPHGSYRTMWAMATLEYTSKSLTFRDIIKMIDKYTIQDAIENENIKYIVRLDPKDQTRIQECKNNINEINMTQSAEILYSNENGFVAKISR